MHETDDPFIGVCSVVGREKTTIVATSDVPDMYGTKAMEPVRCMLALAWVGCSTLPGVMVASSPPRKLTFEGEAGS